MVAQIAERMTAESCQGSIWKFNNSKVTRGNKNHKVLGTIHWFPRWLATLEWDPFIWEPPSELVAYNERRIRMLYRWTKSFQETRDRQVILGILSGKNNSALMVDILFMQFHQKKWRKNCHLADNFSTQNSNLIYSTTQLYYHNSTTKNTTYNLAQHVSQSSQFLEQKQGKYHKEGDRRYYQLELKIEKYLYK